MKHDALQGALEAIGVKQDPVEIVKVDAGRDVPLPDVQSPTNIINGVSQMSALASSAQTMPRTTPATI